MQLLFCIEDDPAHANAHSAAALYLCTKTCINGRSTISIQRNAGTSPGELDKGAAVGDGNPVAMLVGGAASQESRFSLVLLGWSDVESYLLGSERLCAGRPKVLLRCTMLGPPTHVCAHLHWTRTLRAGWWCTGSKLGSSADSRRPCIQAIDAILVHECQPAFMSLRRTMCQRQGQPYPAPCVRIASAVHLAICTWRQGGTTVY